MKKILSLLCGSLVVLLMFVGSGNVALAHGGDDCGCPDLITGAEKNKIVADLLKSQAFKSQKAELLKNRYKWRGIKDAEVINNEIFFNIKGNGVAVTFYAPDGTPIGLLFSNDKGYFDIFDPTEIVKE